MRISDWSSDVCSSDLTGVDAHRAGLRSDDRVCDAEREIVMRMHPALRFGLEDPIVSFEAGPDAVHVEGSAAVGYIDAMGAISLHEQGLLRERFGIDHMAHHQERSEEHTSELHSLMRISYAVFCLKKKNTLYTPIT